MNLLDIEELFMPSPKRFPERFPETYDELLKAGVFPKRIEDIQEQSPDESILCSCDWRIKRTFIELVKLAKERQYKSFGWVENDVRFCDNFLHKAKSIEFPDDWEIVYFGCVLASQGERVNERFITSPMIHGFQFVLFHERAYDRLIEAVSRINSLPVDDAVTRYEPIFKKYAVYPNMAWQRDVVSTAKRNTGARNSEIYDPETGAVRINNRFYPQ